MKRMWLCAGVVLWSSVAAVQAADAEAPAEQPKLTETDTITQYGITWKLEKKAPVGQFVTGDYYVVGPVTVVAIDPAPAEGKNGSELNPATGTKQGYNKVTQGFAKTLAYDPALSAKLPIAMKPGDSLVSSVGYEPNDRRRNLYIYATSASASKAATVLTCLEKAVPADTFRPSYCGHPAKLYRYADLKLDLLPRLKPAKGEPNVAAYERVFERPWIDHVYDWGSRETHPGLNMPDYGQSIARAVSEASLLLLCDHPIEQKRKLLVGFVQYGIDLMGCLDNGLKGWPQEGGFGSGRKWPILFAGLLLGDEKMQHVRGEFGDDQGTETDHCWTGANVCFTGHSGKDGRGDPERGEYEFLHPSRWPGTESEGYRRCCNSHCWVGYALAARVMHAERLWDHDAFFAYVDRWMNEDDADAVKQIERAYKARGWQFGTMGNAYARQGHSWEDWVTAMWKEHRAAPGMGEDLCKPIPGVTKGSVQVDAKGGFVADGKPFFPILLVEQTPDRIPLAKELGVNAFLGSGWKNGAFDRPCSEFLAKLSEAGLYGVFGADARLAGNDRLLGYLQYDQPDRARVIREADVTLDDAKRGDRGHPPAQVADGDTRAGKGALFGPLEGMTVTIKVKAPVTAAALALFVDRGSPTLPSEVAFLADGKEILKTAVKRQDGQQRSDLKEPVTFKTLAVKVLSVESTAVQKWGRIDEIQALDKDGKPISLFSERREPLVAPEGLEDVYKWCKGRDSSKPVFVSFASFAAGGADAWEPNEAKTLYGGYLKSCDAAGFEADLSLAPKDLGAAVKSLRETAGAFKAIFVVLKVAKAEKAEGLAARVLSAAAAAVKNSASGIGYRLEGLDAKSRLDPALCAELKKANDAISSHAAELLADPSKAETLLK